MAVLLQDDQAKIEHHVSFFSLRIFSKSQQNYSTNEKEAFSFIVSSSVF